eukprot:3261724-Ditylum_brightwellii.AAC.1
MKNICSTFKKQDMKWSSSWMYSEHLSMQNKKKMKAFKTALKGSRHQRTYWNLTLEVQYS